MRKKRNNWGFSLTEMLLAVGTLSIGMIFVGGVFPVAIHFSTIASERTIAAVVADEAFAKIRLYGEVDPDWVSQLSSTASVAFEGVVPINPDEFLYPSNPDTDISQRRYYWYAVCRRLGNTRLVQVTVFVSRRISAGATYWHRANPADALGVSDYPVPVLVNVWAGSSSDELLIIDVDPAAGTPEQAFINDDYTIVDDQTGRLYRVMERYPSPGDDTIRLDGDWQGDSPAWVWVVPPPVNGGRHPCVGVCQKVIGFWAF